MHEAQLYYAIKHVHTHIHTPMESEVWNFDNIDKYHDYFLPMAFGDVLLKWSIGIVVGPSMDTVCIVVVITVVWNPI